MEQNTTTQAGDEDANKNTNANKNEDNKDNGNGGQGNAKTFTQEELNETISKRLKAEKEKSQKETQEAIDRALAEERRLAKLSSDEKEKELKAKQDSESKERENNTTRRENRLTALETFAELELPKDLVDFVVDLDVEKQSEKIQSFKKAFDASVAERVKQRLEGKGSTKDVNNSDKTTDDGTGPQAYF